MKNAGLSPRLFLRLQTSATALLQVFLLPETSFTNLGSFLSSYLTLEFGFQPLISDPASCEAAGAALSPRVPAAHMGDLVCVSSSWPCLGPALAVASL